MEELARALKLAEVEVQRWMRRLSRTQIRAPKDGTVVSVLGSAPGWLVAAGDAVAVMLPDEPPATQPTAIPRR